MATTVDASSQAGQSEWETSLRQALKAADINLLRMACYQISGDEWFAALPVDKIPDRGGVYQLSIVPEQFHAEILSRAFDLLRDGRPATPPVPSLAEARHLMEMYTGGSLTEKEARFFAEELAFEDNPRGIDWSKRPDQKAIDRYHVTIIGAGVSGMTAGIYLERLGIPYTIIERQSDLGGTWERNTYPGVRVDVPSFVYQHKFEKNYPWPEQYPTRLEVKKYLKYMAEKYGIAKNIIYNTDVSDAEWDAAEHNWKLTLSGPGGETSEVRSPILVSAVGLFNAPKFPDISGLSDFQGKVMHTTEWDHDFNFSGKACALIGNGSSGTQVAPFLGETCKSLSIFQRTPSWFSELAGYHDAMPGDLTWLFDNVPFYWNWFCYSKIATMAQAERTQVIDHEWRKNGGIVSEVNDTIRKGLVGYIERRLESRPDLISRCIPTYAPMARRMVVEQGWFETLHRPNVQLVTGPVDHVTSDAIVANGQEHKVDVIVLGTGFEVSRFLWPVRYTGSNGETLETAWSRDGARSYLGMLMPNFPNFFMFYGPNSQPRTGSFHSWTDIWARYMAKTIMMMIEGGSTSVEVKRSSFEDYNRALDDEAAKCIWQYEGQGGYYVNEYGRPGAINPWPVAELHSRLFEPDRQDFELAGALVAESEPG